MLTYLVRRVALGVVVLFVVSILTFVIFFKLPAGDPARLITRKPATSSEYLLARHNLGLDRPLLVQYWRYAKGIIPLPGFFLNKEVYFSYQSNIPVREELARRAPYTIALGLGGELLTLLISVPLGIGAGLRPGSWVGRAANLYVLFSVSTPTFWFGALALFFFWFKLGIAPPSGIPSNESALVAVLHGRYILPWCTAALGLGAIFVQLLRGELSEVMTSDYVRTARAKGVPARRITLRHGVRSSLSSVLTVLGFDLASIIGGAVIIETVFNIPGIGRYAVESLRSSDLPAVMGTTIIFSIAIVAMNILIDVAYVYLDPRIRLTGARSS
jgi:peptide/nickel transport system permease protein